jgi:Mg2+ and Co2+ transporter CorA
MQIPADWQLPPQLSQRLGDRPGRQRHMFHDGHLLLIIHKVPLGRTPERSAVYFYKNPEGNWQSTSRGSGIAAMNQLQEAYEKAIDNLEAKMENADDATAYFSILQDVQPIHRASSNMLAALQCARDEAGPDKSLIIMRDRAAEIDRAAALLHEEARNAMDFYLAMQAEIQAKNTQKLNVAAHRLNVMAALFLPLMALASLFGMNLPSGIEHAHPIIFWGILFASLFIGLIVTFAATRQK